MWRKKKQKPKAQQNKATDYNHWLSAHIFNKKETNELCSLFSRANCHITLIN